MATMTHRTSFALDERTAQRIKRLAIRWNVSQAEVVRRSVERAEDSMETSQPSPLELLRQLHAKGGGISKSRADRWIKEIADDRKRWRASS
jgi:predicted DNA-binding protein